MEFDEDLMEQMDEQDELPLLEGDEEEEAAVSEPEAEQEQEATERPAPSAFVPDPALREQRVELAALREEQEQRQGQDARLLSLLHTMGYQGDLHTVADAIEAQQRAIPVEQIRAEREGRLAIAGEQHKVQMAKAEAEDMMRQAVFAADLAEIQRLDPSVKQLEDLGDRFVRLRAAGFENVEAYELLRSERVPAAAAMAGGKEHLTTTGGGTASAVAKDIPAAQMDFWKDSFPEDTQAQLKARYNRAMKRQEGE